MTTEQKIRQIVKEKGLSLRKLSKMLGKEESYMGQTLRRKIHSIFTLKLIAKALKVNIKDLL